MKKKQMKSSRYVSRILTAAIGSYGGAALAANGTWITNGGGAWSVTTNWSGGTIANASGGTADFSTLDLTADAVITLDSARTLTNLKFGDTGATLPLSNWTLSSTNASALTLAGTTPTLTVNNGTTTVSLVIAGSAGLTKAGSGALLLSGTNTFTGGVNASAGSLIVGNASAWGSGNLLTLSGSALLDLNGFGTTVTGIVGAAGNVITDNSSIAGTTVLTGGPTGATTTRTFAGNIQDGANGRIVAYNKTGPGIEVFSGNNTYSGGTTISAGTLRFVGASSLPAAGNLNLNGGTIEVGSDFGRGLGTGSGQVQLQGSSAGISANGGNVSVDLSGTGAGSGFTLTWGGASFNPTTLVLNESTANSQLTLVNGLDLNTASSRTLNVNGGSVVLSAGVSATGGGGLTKGGGGTLVLSGANSYSGGTTINGGLVQFNAGALPASGTITVASGGALAVSGDFTTVGAWLGSGRIAPASAGALGLTGSSSSENISLSGYASLGIGAAAGSTVSYTGTITPSGTTYLVGGAGGTLQLPNANSLTGARSVTFGGAGTGTVVVGAANNYTGGTTISGGSVQLGNINALGTGGLTIGAAGTLDLNGLSITVPSLTGTSGGIITDSSTVAGTTTLTVNPASGSTTFQATIQNGAGGRILALTKSGAGTLVLNKANGNTYTGATTITGGTLDVKVNNAQVLPATSPLVFGGTGTLLLSNNATGTASLTLGSLSFTFGEGTVTLNRQGTGTTEAITIGSLASRSTGAVGYFSLQNTQTPASPLDPSVYKVTFTTAPTTGRSLDGGIYFFNANDSNGVNFAAYDSTGYVRDLRYGTDSNAVDVNLAANQADLGSVSGKDVQLRGGFSITNQPDVSIRTLKIGSASNLSVAGGSTLTLSSGGILKTGGNSSTIGGSGAITTGGSDLVVRTDVAADTLVISAPISAATTGLTKTGSGTLVVSGTNAYTGNTTLHGGTTRFDSASSIGGSGASILVNSGANVAAGYAIDQAFLSRINPASLGNVLLAADSANNLDLSVAGANLTGGLGAIGSAALSGTITPNGTSYKLGAGGGVLTINSQLSGANALNVGLAGTNSGTVVLAAANTFTGGTTANAGTLRLANSSALAQGALHVAGGTVDLSGTDQAVSSLSGANAGTITDSSAVPGTTKLTVNNTGSATFSGTISDGSSGRKISVVKDGPGTLIVNKANGNTYTGATEIKGGRFEVRTNNAQVVSANTDVVFSGSGTFAAANNGGVAVTTAALTVKSLTFGAGDGTVESNKLNASTTNTLTFGGSLTRATGATGNFIVTGGASASAYKVVLGNAPVTGQSIDGGIYFGGADFAAYDSAGFVRNLQYGTDANAANVVLVADQASLGSVDNNDVQLSGGTFAVTNQITQTIRTLKIAGANNISIDPGQVLNLSAGGLLKTGGGIATIGGAGTLATPGELVVRTDQATDTLVLSAVTSVTSGITKTGAGKLLIAPSAQFNGPVRVNGGSLGGSGAITGPVTLTSGALLSPGDSAGILTVTGNVKSDGASFALDVNGATEGTGYDQLVVTSGNVDLGIATALQITSTGYVPAPGDALWIINNLGTGITSGQFRVAGVAVPEGGSVNIAGTSFEIHYGAQYGTSNLTGGNDVVLLAQVPEPSTWLLATGALLGMSTRRRRRVG